MKVDGNTQKIKESYIYGNGEKILTHYYKYDEDGIPIIKEELNFTDIQGNLILTMDSITKQITAMTKYSPYGSIIYGKYSKDKDIKNIYSYTGKEQSFETGLVYFGARW